MSDDLTIPSFLVRERSKRPLALKLAYVNGHRRFKRRPVGRPEGQRWENATLREVFLYDEAPKLGCGLRRVWVAEGRRWCKLAGTDGARTKIEMSVWATIARRKVA